ncbi:lipid-A-disaccharide synthase [Varunaivibrio sulfuroxidans]|uniref:Lipid-A-disaccharide synthase n=1 Tax=Varunaivibrio sulfuroxidans TaxID=1773489 RepID=A0A4R3JG36_9PROT|nr:lipid-A-disaccharide synthase [Varunaivibrio sulfuroxidans]TCS64166.1 lipid-A-disaccharide synthase [Varunaivibrio sulfuroxidans]WES31388.1 lipid-A-disaccharide synthase [Varunaivibrio sulfuroxidans]
MQPKLGILAGGGALPARLIRACRDSGRDFFVIAFNGQTDRETVVDTPHAWIRLGAAGRAIAVLKREGVRELVMAGAIRRPSLAHLWPDLRTLRFALGGAFSRGDDGLLCSVVRTLERDEGFRIIGVHDVLHDLLARAGVLGTPRPTEDALADMRIAAGAAWNLGRRDIGQAAIARGGDVIAREDRLGTDAMMAKLGASQAGARTRGVLVKISKPGQERRVDLPTIGVDTIENARKAGLTGIAVEAGGALIVDRDAVIAAADKAGLFVYGMSSGEIADLRRRHFFIIAGEPSGDELGGRLMASLREIYADRVHFSGIGGVRMAEQGLDSLFPMSELSVMGLAEVLPKLPTLIGRIRETARAVRRERPDCLVCIDAPDFNFRVARKLKGVGIALVHYVAPTVWAWRAGRARKVARFLDHMLCLLPFEPPYFEKAGLAATFVGHPIVESGADAGDGARFRADHAIAPATTLVAVLPGSRHSETSKMLPVFARALTLLARDKGEFHVVIPCVAARLDDVRAATRDWPFSVSIVIGVKDKYDALAATDVALAASGTVALELALSKTPTVIAYKLNPLTVWLARRLVRVRFANLINIILDREAVPEFLNERCRPELLCAAVARLMDDAAARRRQIEDAGAALEKLGLGGPSPGMRAAKCLVDIVESRMGE